MVIDVAHPKHFGTALQVRTAVRENIPPLSSFMSRKAKSVTVLTGNQKKLFNDALDLYDRKQYNRALQNTKRIQKASPNNGEALALEGLICHSLGDKNEGYSLVKKGLGITLRYPKLQKEICLPFCFRAYALMYQKDLNFEKCCASFLNALRFDPENKLILRDLAHSQTMLQDWSGLINTLRKLIKVDLSETKNWLALSLAFYQLGLLKRALSVVEKWLEHTENELKETRERHKSNDLFFKKKRVGKFRMNLLFEMKEYEKVKNEIVSIQQKSKDPDLENLLGRVCFELGDKEKGSKIILNQLFESPENHDLIRLFQRMKFRLDDDDLVKEGVYTNPEDVKKLLEIYDELASKIPKVMMIKRIPLTLCEGEEFERRFFEFVKPMLTRTVPSLFESLKSLYQNPIKISQIEKIMLEIEKSLDNDRKFPAKKKKKNEEEEGEEEEEEEEVEEEESPSTALFCYLFLSKHFDKVGNREKAMEYIEKGISHTPTLCELYMTKARILKHLGRYREASDCMEQSRKLDLADRFLNTKSVEYLVRTDKLTEAYRVSYLFANDHDSKFNLHEQQGVKFEMGLGRSFRRLGRLCLSWREFDRVREYFLKTRKNMNGFHDYFLKKCSVVEYMGMVEYVAGIKREELYLEATMEAAEVLLMFHSNPSMAERRLELTKEERKCWMITEKDRERMDFLFGEYVTSGGGFLGRALEYVRELEEHMDGEFRTHDLAMEVYKRLGKHLLLVRAVKKGLKTYKTQKLKNMKKEGGFGRCKKAFLELLEMPIPESMNKVSKSVLQEEIKILEEFFDKNIN